ncbi:MAG: hypothetical protein ACK46T_40505, partial [Bradyrhizobium sp.]
MDDDPFNRRPPLSPFLEDVRRAQEPAGLVATLGAILGGLVLMFPFGCVMALMRREWAKRSADFQQRRLREPHRALEWQLRQHWTQLKGALGL